MLFVECALIGSKDGEVVIVHIFVLGMTFCQFFHLGEVHRHGFQIALVEMTDAKGVEAERLLHLRVFQFSEEVKGVKHFPLRLHFIATFKLKLCSVSQLLRLLETGLFARGVQEERRKEKEREETFHGDREQGR